MTPADLKAFAAVMAEMRVLRLKTPDAAEIELHPSAFLPAAAGLPDAEPEPDPKELLFASSVPVTDWERNGKDPG